MTDKPVAILINAYSAKVGGGKTYIQNLLTRIPSEKVNIYLYAPEDFFLPENPSLVRLKTFWPTNHPALRMVWEFFLLPFTIRKLGIDCLFVPGGVHVTQKWMLLKTVKIVTMFRNMIPFDSEKLGSESDLKEKILGSLRRWTMLATMSGADHVIFISKFAKSVIEKHILVKESSTIPHGITDQFLMSPNQVKPRPELPFSGEYFLYVSRFEFYKRHLQVVQAFELLPEDVKQKYKLLFVGGTDLPYGKQVLDYASQSPEAKQIVFLGHYPYSDLPALYQNAKINIFASICENCPNILLEAMGAGRPILSSDYQPMPEFGGDAIDYASPDQPKQMAVKVIEILNRSKSDEESIKKRLHARSAQFGWATTAEKTWELLIRTGRPSAKHNGQC